VRDVVGVPTHYWSHSFDDACTLDMRGYGEAEVKTYLLPVPAQYRYFPASSRMEGIVEEADYCVRNAHK
jgi:hypothetical protein